MGRRKSHEELYILAHRSSLSEYDVAKEEMHISSSFAITP